jgi:hypothetical protein
VPLLVDPDQLERPDAAHKEQLRRNGPVRIVARLGAEKGVASLLAAAAPVSRPVQIVLASAGFEAEPGSQQALLGECRALAASARADLRPALAWHQVPVFLAGAAVTIIPSSREPSATSRWNPCRPARPRWPTRPGTCPRCWAAPQPASWFLCSPGRADCGRQRGICSLIRYGIARRAGPRTAGHGTTVLPISLTHS